jgi:hypothetical protein
MLPALTGTPGKMFPPQRVESSRPDGQYPTEARPRLPAICTRRLRLGKPCLDLVENDEQIEVGDVAGEPFLQSLLRQRHEPARSRRPRRPVTVDAKEWSLWQPDGATDLAGGDPDQHQVHSRLAELVFGRRRCPARQRQFLSVGKSHSWPDDIDLAALIASCRACAPSGDRTAQGSGHAGARTGPLHRQPSSRAVPRCRRSNRSVRSRRPQLATPLPCGA